MTPSRITLSTLSGNIAATVAPNAVPPEMPWGLSVNFIPDSSVYNSLTPIPQAILAQGVDDLYHVPRGKCHADETTVGLLSLATCFGKNGSFSPHSSGTDIRSVGEALSKGGAEGLRLETGEPEGVSRSPTPTC